MRSRLIYAVDEFAKFTVESITRSSCLLCGSVRSREPRLPAISGNLLGNDVLKRPRRVPSPEPQPPTCSHQLRRRFHPQFGHQMVTVLPSRSGSNAQTLAQLTIVDPLHLARKGLKFTRIKQGSAGLLLDRHRVAARGRPVRPPLGIPELLRLPCVACPGRGHPARPQV